MEDYPDPELCTKLAKSCRAYANLHFHYMCWRMVSLLHYTLVSH